MVPLIITLLQWVFVVTTMVIFFSVRFFQYVKNCSSYKEFFTIFLQE